MPRSTATRTTPDRSPGLVKENATAKFDESVDIAVNLGVDAKKSDQLVRGSVVLPGTGKTVRVAVFAQGDKAEAARAAGADIVVSTTWPSRSRPATSISICASPPRTPCVVGALGQILGPRGLMPNPKVGTVTMDVTTAVKNAKAGQVQYRTDKAGLIHATVGRASFSVEALQQNVAALVDALVKAKPAAQGRVSAQGCRVVHPWAPASAWNPPASAARHKELWAGSAGACPPAGSSKTAGARGMLPCLGLITESLRERCPRTGFPHAHPCSAKLLIQVAVGAMKPFHRVLT